MSERGTLLGGRYELDQIIGRGGMAEVWRAHDTRLVRDVAVKRLRLDLASDPTFQARFRREAQSAAGLNHPNIVAVYDTGEERDPKSDVMVPYIVMELVEGITLREVLRDGRRILPARALEFTAGVLDALAYSHRAGIIHRDIKPANVMLTPSGTVKVMDFGIARAVADTSATMTQTAAVIGTAQYLSPEQARGEKVDNRSDLYSVGCLMYELLCSEPPFKGDSPVSVAYQHVREAPVPPSQRDPEVTPAMDAIVLKALAKAPMNRYQDAREFRDDIMRALNGQTVHASTPTSEMPTSVLPSAPAAATAVMSATPARRAADPGQFAEPAGGLAAAPTGTLPPVEEEPEEEESKSRKKLWAVLGVLGVLLVGAIVWTAYAILNPPTPQVTTVAVPAVVGSDRASAEKQITDAGLIPAVTEVPSQETEKGKVVTTDPTGGTQVDKGSTVTLSIGAGPNTLKVPNLEGKTFEEAKKALQAAGFTGEITEKDADPATEDPKAKKGTVVSSDPVADADVAPDQKFTLYIATGTSEVPDFSGKTFAEAQALYKEKGFTGTLKSVEKEDTTKEAGKVFEQDPKAGTALTRSKDITVTVATAAKTAKMPNLIGMDEQQARSAFKAAGFTSELRIRIEENPINVHPADRVYQQSHQENDELPVGEAVEVVISKAPTVQPPSTAPTTTPPPQSHPAPGQPDN